MAIGLGISRVLVVGASKTGLAVVEALRAESVEVLLLEDFIEPRTRDIADQARALGAEVHLGPGAPTDHAMQLVVPSPGVPPGHWAIRDALQRGIPVWSEVELGWRFRKGPVLAVTGTNGKTTTTMLIQQMLEASGFPAVTAGNIGLPLITAARASSEQTVLVAEVSSFQLAFVESFRPSVAVVLNVADDHYDWHSGFDDYVDAKSKITQTQSPDDHLVVRMDDEGCRRIAAGSRARLIGFGWDEPAAVRERVAEAAGRFVELGVGVGEDRLLIGSSARTYGLMPRADIRLQGPHNVENVMAAAAASIAFGANADAIADAVRAFEPPAHRMAFVARKAGVTYIDDSKATNPHAAVNAIAAYDSVVLIAGGRSRGIDLTPLMSVKDRIKALVVMGESAEEVSAFFADVPSERAADVEEAVELAAGVAKPGDTVLLSPAFPSQDQYRDYAERGERFTKAVLSWQP